MKKETFNEAMQMIDDELIEEATNVKKRKKKKWMIPLSMAACVCLMIGSYYLVTSMNSSSSPSTPKDAVTNTTDGSTNGSSNTTASDNADMKAGTNGETDGMMETSVKAAAEPTYPQDSSNDDLQIRDENPVSDKFYDSMHTFSYQTASKILANQNQNSLYSPVSLYYALSLAAAGAKGDTQKEFLSALNVSDASTLAKECGNLYRLLYQDNATTKLKIANSLWLNKVSSFKQDYLTNASKNFFASVFSADFSNPSTGNAISQWISKNTNGTLSPDVKTDSSELLKIINTIYFNDQWTDEFTDPTTTESFQLADGSTIEAPFMNTTKHSSYYKGDLYSRSSLYMDHSWHMVFILPDNNVTTESLLSSPEKIKELFDSKEDLTRIITWKVPKFSYNADLNLNDTLKDMGIQKAFENADFSNISDNEASLSSVIQKTHIGVNEKGVEASSFTELGLQGSAFITDKADMILNRPFIYGITSNDGTLLFVGVCQNPAQK